MRECRAECRRADAVVRGRNSEKRSRIARDFDHMAADGCGPPTVFVVILKMGTFLDS